MRGAGDGEAGDRRFFHGTRAALQPGDLIAPDGTTSHVFLTPDLDEAIWDAELAGGEGPARVYRVEPAGGIRKASELVDWKSPGHPSMSWCSSGPLRVTG